jgi:glycosyltransferase involved in cell wall biosynthesis
MNPEVSVVIPLYNEEEVFSKLKLRLDKLADSLPYPVEFVIVDDGSKDATASLMQLAALEDARYKAVFLSRNYGHQIAVTAGMSAASATRAVMIIDGDLQDPPELLHAFYQKIQESALLGVLQNPQ